MATDKAMEMMKAVWLKAFKDGEVVLNFPVKADAVRARFMLYNTAKKVKTGKKGQNLDLEDAVEACMISVTSETQFIVRHKALSPLLQCIGEQLGLDAETLHIEDEVDVAARESLRRMEERLAREAEKEKESNPRVFRYLHTPEEPKEG